MKKNFFKKLAFVLAFAMVATSIAPVSAGAATTPTIKGNATQYLLLNDEADTSYDFNINNKVTGSKYSWSSSDEAVATVDNSGVVEAVGIGTAKITCKITFPTKKTKKLYATVIVKENMDSITISNAPTAAIAIGTTYDLNRTYTTLTGGKSTDVTKWFITKGNDKKVASIDNYGKFVSTDAGEFEVVARSYQSNAKFTADAADFTAESAPVTVKVVPSIVSITQKTATTFDVAFDAVMKDVVNKDNLTISNVNGVKLPIVKSVTFDSTGKIATVETFISLNDAAVYKVAYGDLSKDFTASVGAVASVVITGPSVIEDNVATDITVKYLDKNGVEVSGNAANLTITNTNNVGWVDGTKITLFNVGDKATIKATYKTGTYNSDWTEVIIPSEEFTVTAVDSLAATLTDNYVWTMASSVSSSAADYTNAVHSIAIGDFAYLNVKTANSSSNYVYTGYTFNSTDSTKLIVDEVTGALYPVATGIVPVVVTNGSNFKAVINVEVKAARAASTISSDKASVNVSTVINQTASYTLTVKDQYGDAFPVLASSAAVTLLSRPSTDTDVNASSLIQVPTTVNADKSATFVFDSTSAVAGTYTYRLAIGGKSVVVSAVVSDSTDLTVTSYRFIVDTKTYDTVVSASSAGTPTLTVKVYGYNKSGIAVADATATAAAVVATNTADSSKTISLTSGSAVIPQSATTGTYVLNGTVNGTKIVANTFEIKNSQVKASIAQNASTLTILTTDSLIDQLTNQDIITTDTATTNVFKAVTNADADSASVSIATGDIVTSAVKDGANVAGTYQVLVKTVTVTETFSTHTVSYSVDVNKVITVTVK